MIIIGTLPIIIRSDRPAKASSPTAGNVKVHHYHHHHRHSIDKVHDDEEDNDDEKS